MLGAPYPCVSMSVSAYVGVGVDVGGCAFVRAIVEAT